MGGDKRISTALKIITVGLLALLVAPILFLLSSAASKTEVAHSAVINRSSYSRHNITTRTRSDHGYIRPHTPFPSLQRTSHTCRIITNNNTEEEEIVHMPTAVPHLILIGAQKSATSQFQAVANRRKNVITPLSVKKFEPHFLSWAGNVAYLFKNRITANNAASNTTADTTTQHSLLLKQEYESKLCKLRQMYTMYFNMTTVINNNESIVMEKTPSYILNDKLPQVIDDLCPWKPKILAILRNPVDRAYSQFRMNLPGPRAMRLKNKTFPLFSTIVQNEIEEFIDIGLLNNETISLDQFAQEQNATTADTTLSALSTSPFVFPPNMTLEKSAQILSNLGAKRKAHSYLIRGMYAPLLLPWVETFAVDDRLMVLKFHEMFDDDENVVDEALRFAGLNDTSIDDEVNLQQQLINGTIKRTGDANHHAMQGKDIGRLDSMTRLYLQMFYRPFNRFLVQLLGDEWEGWGE
jgi:hypothetical protein